MSEVVPYAELFVPRRTGVIVAVHESASPEGAAMVREQLEERFPGVRFAVIAGGSSVAFEYDEVEP